MWSAARKNQDQDLKNQDQHMESLDLDLKNRDQQIESQDLDLNILKVKI